ncbi:MAG: ATP-dependent helicase HrpB [Leptospiraceae bacterium]|nr:ATP-dependent helicase HrpB [Leptospiraceae bacterium]
MVENSLIQFPIYDILDHALQVIKENDYTVLLAEPGAGKTTIIPLEILVRNLFPKKTLILEPRKIAVKSACNRISELANTKPGEEIGYRVRFETLSSNDTKIEFLTEGIFIKKIINDPELSDVSLLIFDEFHERSLESDLGLALALKTKELFRPDLKILIMSATIDSERISKFLGKAPVLESKGRNHSVEIHYEKELFEPTIENIAKKIINYKSKNGDTLVFLSGSNEIRRIKSLLESYNLDEYSIFMLYGDLDWNEQQKALKPHNKKKIILSTNIAETSLTIIGVNVVIDSGFEKRKKYNPSSKMEQLIKVRISKSSAKQRAYRAGRISSGTCYRLWSLYEEREMEEDSRPEILDSELSGLILTILSYGDTISNLRFLDNPKPNSIELATDLLENLGFTKDRQMTEKGIRASKLPTSPILANLLIKAKEIGESRLGCKIVALLSTIDSSTNEDFQTLVESSSHNTMKKIQSQLESNLSVDRLEKPDYNKTGLLVSFAFPDWIAKKKIGEEGKFKLANGKTALINKDNPLSEKDFLAVASLDGNEKNPSILYSTELSFHDIIKYHSESIIELTQIDSDSDRIQFKRIKKLGEIILEEKIVSNTQDSIELKNFAKEKIKSLGLKFFDKYEKFLLIQSRLTILKKYNFDFPELSEEFLLNTLDQWLLPYINSFQKLSDLKNLAMIDLILNLLTYEQKSILEREAPEAFITKKNRRIPLKYKDNEVFLSIKIQDLFGMTETPRIGRGKIPITLEILSPAMRPVQITKDLNSFWKNTYPELRKELKIKYPKHIWLEV